MPSYENELDSEYQKDMAAGGKETNKESEDASEIVTNAEVTDQNAESVKSAVEPIRRKTWSEFRNSGLLWFINTILHAFGWIIVYEIEDDTIKDVYPARTSYRGYPEDSNSKGYIELSKYMKENASDLFKESIQ